MFLVIDKNDHFIFLQADPSMEENFHLTVVKDVEIRWDMKPYGNGLWPDSTERSVRMGETGQNPNNRKQYRYFKCRDDLIAAGYEMVDKTHAIKEPPREAASWSEYLKQCEQRGESTT